MPPADGDSVATTPATSLNPCPTLARHNTVSDQETSRPADTDVTTPSFAPVDTEEANSDETIGLLNIGDDAKRGDKSAESEGAAKYELDSNISIASTSDRDEPSDRNDMGPRQLNNALKRVSDARTRNIFNMRSKQHRNHIQLTEDRIMLMEKRLDKLENKPPLPRVVPPLPPQQVVAIPELNFVDWATFKASTTAIDVGGEPRYAIDVLLGEPRLFVQRHKMSNDMDGISRLPSREVKNMPLKAVPERIRINSIPLNEAVKTTLAMSNRVSSMPLVILSPYKALLHHEEEFRNTLAALAKLLPVRSDMASGRLRYPSRGTIAKMPSLPLERMREAVDELRCLLRFIESLKPLIEKIRNWPCSEDLATTHRAVTLFKDLWYIFHPGQYLFSRLGIQETWRVIQITGGRKLLSVGGPPSAIDALRVQPSSSFEIDCYYLDFDGSRFGPVHRRFQIRPFEGLRQITSLDVYPIEYQSDHKDMIENLTKRGAEFVALTQVSHKYFKGRTIVSAPDGTRMTGTMHEHKAHGVSYPEQVESPVIVDFNRTIQFNPEWCPKLSIGDLAEQHSCETLEMSPASERRHPPMCPPGFTGSGDPYVLGAMCKNPGCCGNEEILRDFQWDRRNMEVFVSKEEILSQYGVDKDYVVSGEQLRLLPNRVFGFILRSRKWACLPLDCLRDVVKHSVNFDALELTGQHKEIVVGLVDAHFKNREQESQSPPGQVQEDQDFDLVKAKECVAETHGKPLFPITCGDLGVDPIDVEKGLEFNFQLAESWGCVLLLDEADVFLAQRGERDLSRNALVSIFLRALEYYSGILFLTTNRVGTIDEAFRSRIHMSLFYPNLNEQQTIKIWKGQLQRALERDPSLIVDQDTIVNYARDLHTLQMRETKVGWNGRQIRNAMKTAISLAEYDCFRRSEALQTRTQPVLEVKWFDVVARASWEFNAYLQRALDMTPMEIAKDWGRRDDEAYPGQEELAMPLVTGGSSSARPPYYGSQLAHQRQYTASQPSLFAVPGGLPSRNTMFGFPQQSFVSAQHAHAYNSPQYMTAMQPQQQQKPQPNAPMPPGGFPEFNMGSVALPSMAPIPGAPQGAPIPTGVNQFSPQQGQQQLFGHYGQYSGTDPQAQHDVPGSLRSTQAAAPMFSGYSNPIASSSAHEQPPQLNSATQALPRQATEPSPQPGPG